MILLDVFTFLGRMHPLIVHLPIGFVLAGLVFHSIAYMKSFNYLDRAVSVTLLIGFSSAIAASSLGLILSLSGDYEGKLLDDHRFSAFILTIMSGVLYAMTTPFCRTLIALPRPAVSVFAIATLLVLSYAGHKGAMLTHGQDYFSLESLTGKEQISPARIEEAFIYEDIVHPILKKRCVECHRDNKRKGRLSMESAVEIFKGGKSGPAVVPHSIEQSELYQRVTLDPSHDNFMPADGKTPLSGTETEIIRWWIEQGAPTETKLSQTEAAEGIYAAASDILGLSTPSELRANAAAPVKSITSGHIYFPAVQNLKRRGLAVRLMLHEPLMLDVSLPPDSGIKISGIENDFEVLAESIVWLNLSGNNISADELGILSRMSNLQKLRLEKNPISDSVSYHLLDLEHLVAVNLNETNITQACISRLQENQAIRRIYTWKTKCDFDKFER